MKQFLMVVLVLSLAACGKLVPTDTVESLVANPNRLNALRVQCKADHAKVGDAVCAEVSEATRRRFMGAGTSPYAKDTVRKPAPPAEAPVDPTTKD